jgi:hypothetical protein
MIYKILTTVKSVEELDQVVSGRKVGDETVLTKEKLGWFVCFEGSWERLYLGFEEPELKVGQQVEILIRGL